MAVQIGRYHLVKCLARGGMAEIWLAQQRAAGGFEKLVAVKRILPGLADREEFIKMFLDEARLAAQLGHPNIVQIYDLGQTGDTYYIAMEFIHGENLRMITRRAADGDGIPISMAVKIVSESAAALHYAHTKTALDGTPLGVVHRDVSPQNLLVSYEGQVKVVDFGIAKAANSLTETRTGVIKGKYPYMSPEQVLARKIDGRSDLFSLGIVMWEALTGHRLYDQPTDFLVMDAIIKKQHAKASTLRPEIPESLEVILDKAMAKLPEDRYPDCHAFHQELERWLHQSGELVSAVELGAFMKGCFPDRLATWGKLLEQRDVADFSSEVLDELSGFMGMTPSSAAGTGPVDGRQPQTKALRPTSKPSESQVARAGMPTGPPAGRPPPLPRPGRSFTDPGVRPPEMMEAAPDVENDEELVAPPIQRPLTNPRGRPLREPEPAPAEEAVPELRADSEPLPEALPEPSTERQPAPSPERKPPPPRSEENEALSEAEAEEIERALREDARRAPQNAEDEDEDDEATAWAPPPHEEKAPSPAAGRRAPPSASPTGRSRKRGFLELVDLVFEPAATLVGKVLQGILAVITIVGMIWAGQGLVKSAGFENREGEIARDIATDLAQGAGIVTPGIILVRSFPAGAEVLVDGKPLGQTPLSRPLKTQAPRIEVELRLKGYRTFQQLVEHPANGVRIEAQLEPALGSLK